MRSDSPPVLYTTGIADPPPAADASHDTSDRRRPGRMKSVSPALVGLLRGQKASVETEAGPRWRDLDPMVGLLVATMIGCAMWVAIYFGVRALFF